MCRQFEEKKEEEKQNEASSAQILALKHFVD
jgi:hypothetical protein